MLGVNWNSLNDELTFEFSGLIQLSQELPKTKRSILRLTASLFDPLGLLSPFVISLKVLFQRLCTNKVNWDESLLAELTKEWEFMVSDLKEFGKLKIPRACILVDQYPVSVCLHGFSDASERTYTAVLSFTSKYPNSHTETRLLCSKTRVAPTSKQTIPRLELLGVLMLSRLVCSVADSLPTLDCIYLWTDSMVALHWVRNKRTWKP